LSATCKTFSECDPGPEKEIVKKMNRVWELNSNASMLIS
jgi:hypothetical protein